MLSGASPANFFKETTRRRNVEGQVSGPASLRRPSKNPGPAGRGGRSFHAGAADGGAARTWILKQVRDDGGGGPAHCRSGGQAVGRIPALSPGHRGRRFQEKARRR